MIENQHKSNFGVWSQLEPTQASDPKNAQKKVRRQSETKKSQSTSLTFQTKSFQFEIETKKEKQSKDLLKHSKGVFPDRLEAVVLQPPVCICKLPFKAFSVLYLQLSLIQVLAGMASGLPASHSTNTVRLI